MRVVIDCNVLISAGLTAGTCRAVIQTALASGAKYLVTGNGNDFPAEICVGVDVVTPAAFLQLNLSDARQA